MAQVVEHILGKDEVTGSSPVSSSKRRVFTCLFVFCLYKIVPKHKKSKSYNSLSALKTAEMCIIAFIVFIHLYRRCSLFTRNTLQYPPQELQRQAQKESAKGKHRFEFFCRPKTFCDPTARFLLSTPPGRIHPALRSSIYRQ